MAFVAASAVLKDWMEGHWEEGALRHHHTKPPAREPQPLRQ